MRRHVLPATLLAALLLAGPAALAAEAPPPSGGEDLRTALLAQLGLRRFEQGLTPLTEVPALTAAAQAHAEELAAGGVLRFTSASGESVEERVEGAGYRAGVVAAKLYRAPARRDAAQLAAEWWSTPSPSRNSVFHSVVTDVGLGIAERDGERFFSFVLTRPRSELADVETSSDLIPLRSAFAEAVNEARKQHHLPPLRQLAVCERAAQVHAEDLLAAMRAGEPTDGITALPLLVQQEQRTGAGESISGGTTIMQRRTTMHNTTRVRGGAVGQAVVVDALAAAQAVATALAAGPSDLTASGYMTLGVGIALDPGGPPPHAVWVACLTRR